MRELKIHKFAEQHLGKPFCWGEMDCNTFILDYMDHMTGSNLLNEAYKKYSGKLSAAKFQAEYPDLLHNALHKSGAREIPKKFVNVGDILIKDLGIYEAAHLVLGSRVMSVDEDKGVVSIPLSDFNFDYAMRIF